MKQKNSETKKNETKMVFLAHGQRTETGHMCPKIKWIDLVRQGKWKVVGKWQESGGMKSEVRKVV